MKNEALNRFVDNFSDVVETAKTEAFFIIKGLENEIIDFNKIQIFVNTELIDNEKITGTYSRFTASLNEGKIFNYGGVTKAKTTDETYFLLDTGKFFDSFVILEEEEGFTIIADDNKSDSTLTSKFGELIGLTAENLNNLSVLFKDKLKEILIIYLLV